MKDEPVRPGGLLPTVEPVPRSTLRAEIPDAGDVYHSEPYDVYVDYELDGRGDRTVETWRLTASEDDGSDGAGFLQIRVHEIVDTERSGRLAVYYRQWFAPNGKPMWGNRPKRVVGSLGSLRALIHRRKMTLTQGTEAGTAETEDTPNDQ